MGGVVALAMFLFSSYSGNDPRFSNLRGRNGTSYLQLTTSLINAFDNDFPDVFKSGTLITVNFKVELRSKGRVLGTHDFRNTVQYDSRQNIYSVYCSATERRNTTSSYRSMITDVALLDCSVPIQQSWEKVDVKVEAWLPSVYFEQINRTVDLMVLWRLQRPTVRNSFNVKIVS